MNGWGRIENEYFSDGSIGSKVWNSQGVLDINDIRSPESENIKRLNLADRARLLEKLGNKKEVNL